MIEPSYALQTAIRARLITSVEVVALVPAAHVLDRNDRPEVFPSILVGEGQTLPGSQIDRTDFEVILDLHLWTKENGLAVVKAIAGAVRSALVASPWSAEGHHVADLRITSTRFMRDPSGSYGHAVVTVEALMKEVS